MTKSELITAVIAVYGAILSTVAIVKQFFSDHIKVKLTVSRDMQMVGDPRYQELTLTILRVTNFGRRPVHVTSLGASGLYPHKSFVFIDTNPRLPYEITEGKFIDGMLDESGVDHSAIDYWFAGDSYGRKYRLQEASWYKHWLSMWQSRRNPSRLSP